MESIQEGDDVWVAALDQLEHVELASGGDVGVDVGRRFRSFECFDCYSGVPRACGFVDYAIGAFADGLGDGVDGSWVGGGGGGGGGTNFTNMAGG